MRERKSKHREREFFVSLGMIQKLKNVVPPRGIFCHDWNREVKSKKESFALSFFSEIVYEIAKHIISEPFFIFWI